MNVEVPEADGRQRPGSPIRRIDFACDQFEAAWREGQEPRIEDVLARTDAADRPALLHELLALEIELRLGRGECVTPGGYRDRFPGQGDLIDAVFDSAARGPGRSRPPPDRTLADAGHNLLFGLLALQNHFVSREALLNAYAVWVVDKARPLGQVLRDRGVLDEDRYALVEALVAEHLMLHGDDPDQSLAAFGKLNSVRRDLERLGDADVKVGLAATTSRSDGSSGDADAWTGAGYEILGELGRGGMGVVYRAFDRRRGHVVALKSLPRLGPSALYRFKREFRAVADVAHPNLVSLYELVSDKAGWFFSMELIEGVDFLAHVRPGGQSPRMDRLRGALRQLAEGVMALHATGRLHRDLKPSNVRVTPVDRVVILDFGLVAELGPDGRHQSTESHVVGTVAYMAPEQAAGQPTGPAADWYSVGVMLHEALTGQLPFTGDPRRVLAAKQGIGSPPPPDRWPDGAEDLGTLCIELLHRDPATRPTGSDILRRLGDDRGASENLQAPPVGGRLAGPLVGRRPHLDVLNAAFAAVRCGRPSALFVRGCSGTGKSTLVQRFLDGLVARDAAVVLAGRCYEQESVPYKALDGLVDALSRYLRRLPEPEAQAVLPRNVLSLARVFPVLRRVEAVATALGGAAEVPEPQELRRRAFAALRELLGRLGDRRPLVLFVDDLQWGDVDSALLLAEVLRPPDPPVLLLLGAYRSEDAATSPFLQGLLSPGEAGPGIDHRELDVDPLTPAEAAELALELIGGEVPGAAAYAEAVAREAQGSPFFVHELVQHARPGPGSAGWLPTAAGVALDDVVWDRVARLPEEAQRLLEVVAVSGHPLDLAAACRAAGLEPGGRMAVALLRSGRLTRSIGPQDHDQIEVYHDRIREVIVSRLEPATLGVRHRCLAFELESSGRADPEVLAIHYLGAGEPERAGSYYALAASQAAGALAFDRAVNLYRLALKLRPANVEKAQHRIELADALANAGRGAEAAQEYLDVVGQVDATLAARLQQRAAAQFFRSGRIDEGVTVMRSALSSLGMSLAKTPGQAIISLLISNLQISIYGLSYRERLESQVPERELARIDTCWSVALSLSMADPIRGADFQARHLLLALKAGEPYRIALGLAWESAHRGLPGRRTHRQAEELLRRATALAERINRPHGLGMASVAAAIVAWSVGDWKRCLEQSERAESIFRDRCTGVAWEIDSSRIFSLAALAWLGEWREHSKRFTSILKEAHERGDRYAETSIPLLTNSYTRSLISDDPENAQDELRRAVEPWSRRAFHIQHYWAIYGQVETALYRGNGRTALNLLDENWPAIKRAFILRIQTIRLIHFYLHARCALAVAAESDSTAGKDGEAARILWIAERDARRIEREEMEWSTPLARLIRAGVAAVRRRSGDSVALLASAEVGLDSAGMALFAAAARRSHGRIVGGGQGRILVEAADTWMAGQDIRNPSRMAAVFAPGFPD
jgi:hypothetical protein